MKDFQLTFESIKTDREGGPVRLLFLSDLHNRTYGRGNSRLLAAIDELRPDLILIGGDQIVAKPGADLRPGLRTAEKLAERYPVYYANGNHEYRLRLYPETYGDMDQRFRASMEASRICYLDAGTADVEIRGIQFHLIGYNMDRAYYHRFARRNLPVEEITNQVGPAEEGRFNILMAHHPGYQDTYDIYGAQLTLSGHYHGGVVGLPGQRGLITPDFHLFRTCCRGRHPLSRGGIHIISAGIGEHTIPFRIFNPREILVIDVKGEA